MNDKITKWLRYIIIAVAFFYFLPFIFLGENSYFTIHDNLDSEVQYLEVLKTSGMMYASGDEIVPNTMNGIPRAAYKSGLNFTSILFNIFPSHWAYILNFIFSHVLAFLGMYLLLKKHIIKEKDKLWVVLLIALLFAVLPFYSIYGLTVAGQPLFFYAYLNLRNNSERPAKSYFLFSLLPFFLIGYLISPFLLIVSAILFIMDWYRLRKFNKKLFMGLLLFFVFTLISDYQMYLMTFTKSEFVSHRTEWQNDKLINLTPVFAIQSMITFFFQTTYHVGSMPTKVILVLALLSFSVTLVDKTYLQRYIVLFMFICSVVVFYGLYFYIEKYLGAKIGLIKIFQWNRFYFLLSFAWLLLFAISISHLANYKILNLFMVLMILFQSVYILRQNKEVINNWKIMMHKPIDEPTYAQFYAKPLFKEIENYIGRSKDSYRVGSLVLNPAVASFNGFYCIDGYQNSYNLNYKHAFRNIIAKELDADKASRDYFDYWGSRCYLTSHEFNTNKKINRLNYDFDAYKKLGGEYLLSSYQITEADSCGLKFEKSFSDNIYYTIYLYKVK